jgi:hypothetical protein
MALYDLFSSPARTWQFGLAVTVPLFTGGRLRGNLKLNETRFQESLAVYQRAVPGAFREVSDGLIAYQRTQEPTPPTPDQNRKTLKTLDISINPASNLITNKGATRYIIGSRARQTRD